MRSGLSPPWSPRSSRTVPRTGRQSRGFARTRSFSARWSASSRGRDCSSPPPRNSCTFSPSLFSTKGEGVRFSYFLFTVFYLLFTIEFHYAYPLFGSYGCRAARVRSPLLVPCRERGVFSVADLERPRPWGERRRGRKDRDRRRRPRGDAQGWNDGEREKRSGSGSFRNVQKLWREPGGARRDLGRGQGRVRPPVLGKYSHSYARAASHHRRHLFLHVPPGEERREPGVHVRPREPAPLGRREGSRDL